MTTLEEVRLIDLMAASMLNCTLDYLYQHYTVESTLPKWDLKKETVKITTKQ